MVWKYDFMTWGQSMVAGKNLVRVQEKGQITLPRAIRDELGIKKGDLVSVEVNGRAASIVPQMVISGERMRQIEEEILASGITLEEMDKFIENTRNARGVWMKETHDISDDN
jgi:AbrB family looped-hinge helix DNA binding protein